MEKEDWDLIVLAHNFSGYDGYFIVNQYRKNCELIEKIRNAGEILQVVRGRIRFIDSRSILAMPLAAFPKTFNLKELKKGYFCHKLNVLKLQSYVGPYPANDYYTPETMSVEGRKTFKAWHATQGGKTFNFQKEL